MLNKVKPLLALTKEYLLLALMVTVFYAAMAMLGHKNHSAIWSGVLVVFSSLKVVLLVSFTFQKLDRLASANHSFNHLLLLLGAVISLIVVSFTFDYLCLLEIYPEAFSGIDQEQSLVYRFLNLLYFSIVTYTTVGYGDIAPIIPAAKLLSVLEIITAFVVIVFILTKYFRK